MPQAYDRSLLLLVAQSDAEEVWKKDQSYGQSWKKRGGVGAFMMLARKWDRLEKFCERCALAFDVFQAIHASGGSGADGAPLAEIRDLRRYLLLVEAEMIARGTVERPVLTKGAADGQDRERRVEEGPF